MHEFGIIFVATKDGRYVDEAQAALASLKEKALSVPATLMTTLPEMVKKTDHGFDLVIGTNTIAEMGAILEDHDLAMSTPTDVMVVPSSMTFDNAMIGMRRSTADDATVEQVCAVYRKHL